MALSPWELQRRIRNGEALTPSQRKRADQIEQKIDETLPRVFRRWNTISLPLPRSASIEVCEEVARRYRRLGWIVDLDGEGHRIVLTPRMSARSSQRFRPSLVRIRQ